MLSVPSMTWVRVQDDVPKRSGNAKRNVLINVVVMRMVPMQESSKLG